jgi:D-3-phosphoglycerate dehydrogenase / 2-oxoglutarate reductase
MRRKRALISSRSLQGVIDDYRDLFVKHDIEIVLPAVRERLSEGQLRQYIADIDGVACGDDYFTEEILRSAKRLKVISKWGTGIDSINLEVCRELGIVVCNTPEAFTEPVADTVLAYILNQARQISVLDKKMRRGIWEKHEAMAMNELTLGIIGTGTIGRAVAKRAFAFDMNVIGCDEDGRSVALGKKAGIGMVAKDEVLRRADFISLNCDLNASSRYLIARREIELMKPEAYLINTARGPVINEHDLAAALKAGRLAGAALDVFEEEPLALDSPLLKLDNVLLAPHNANASSQAHRRVHRLTIKNLIKVMDGQEKPACCQNAF